jgi:nitroimidazol reductase NimA-like FMN-containing flavoprotein (pyridoxamine 5'-phosphate oxidase superfamily)
MRKPISMTDDESYAFLDGQLTAVFSTIGPAGYPHQVNMMFAPRPGLIEFTAFSKSQKVRNIHRNGAVSLLAEDPMPYNEIIGGLFIGDAEIVDDYDAVVRVATTVAERYQRIDPANWAINPEVDIAATAKKRVLIRLDVKKIVSWDHRKLLGSY